MRVTQQLACHTARISKHFILSTTRLTESNLYLPWDTATKTSIYPAITISPLILNASKS